MRITLGVILCLAVGPVWAEDAITSDAVKAAQEPSGEFQSYQEHQRGVHASAQAFADAYAKASDGSGMTIGTENASSVEGGRTGLIPFPFPE